MAILYAILIGYGLLILGWVARFKSLERAALRREQSPLAVKQPAPQRKTRPRDVHVKRGTERVRANFGDAAAGTLRLERRLSAANVNRLNEHRPRG